MSPLWKTQCQRNSSLKNIILTPSNELKIDNIDKEEELKVYPSDNNLTSGKDEVNKMSPPKMPPEDTFIRIFKTKTGRDQNHQRYC